MDAENRKPESEDLDRWLDVVLRERANAEPRGGLEERVLARLSAEPPRRIIWWPAVAAVSALLVVVIALVVIHPRRQEPVIANKHYPAISDKSSGGRDATCCVSTAMSARSTTHAAVRPLRKHRRPESPAASDSLPKLATFPAPRAATTEERLLAQLATRQGSYEIANISNDVRLRDLSIPELRIEPMEGTPPDNAPQE